MIHLSQVPHTHQSYVQVISTMNLTGFFLPNFMIDAVHDPHTIQLSFDDLTSENMTDNGTLNGHIAPDFLSKRCQESEANANHTQL